MRDGRKDCTRSMASRFDKPKGLAIAGLLLGGAAFLSGMAALNGAFVLDSSISPIAGPDVGPQALPWLIAGVVIPIIASAIAFAAYRSSFVVPGRFRAFGVGSAVASAAAAVIAFMSAGFMFKMWGAGTNLGSVNPSEPWTGYAATSFLLYVAALFLAGSAMTASIVSTARHSYPATEAPRSEGSSRPDELPARMGEKTGPKPDHGSSPDEQGEHDQ
jgi:hypothetical protein